MAEAGGCAAGFSGRLFNFNADAEAKLADALFTIGKYVQGESGCLLGHIKAAVYTEEGNGITLNLIDMDNGVEHHGTMPRSDEVKFNFMCAVLDVDEYELTHKMLHAIDDSGLDYFIDKESLEDHLEHHHHHDGECDDPHCSCHHHASLASMIDENGHFSHHHHHHEHGEECHCHEHHDHEHHHHDGECSCGHHHDEKPAKEEKKKKGFFSFLRRRKD